MRILFIENREKTRFWAAVAEHLAARGFVIGWAVQNPMFASNLPGDVFQIPFPSADQAFEGDWQADQWPILASDRGREHFEAGHGHYPHYQQWYRRIFDAFQPELVLGECTLFHELLAIAESQSRGIPFLHPAAERYPQDRFCFFEGISQVAIGGDATHYPQAEALAYAARIAEGREVLVYMRERNAVQSAVRKLEWAWTRGRIFAGRLAGERFNTPSLRRKRHLGQIVKRRLAEWRSLERNVPSGARAILHPLQMEPETNINVWGRPYHDQVATITSLLAAAPDDVLVAVKCNPKPKYEMTAELLDLARNDPRVVLLPFSMKMPEAMAQCLGAITVCGTVGLEAVFGKGRCLSLRHPVITETCPDHAADTPEAAVGKLLNLPDAGLGSPEQGAQMLQAISARSYPGYVCDPFSNSACLEPANVAKVAAGVEHVARIAASGSASRALAA